MILQNKVKNSAGQLTKAGGIVIKKDSDKDYVLMVYRGRHNDWSFPKGHAEVGETVQEVAIREIREEAGIKIEVIRELSPNKYFNPNSNEETVCNMYLLKPLTIDIKSEHQGDKVEWVPIDEVSDRISHPNLRDYFNRVIVEIEEVI